MLACILNTNAEKSPENGSTSPIDECLASGAVVILRKCCKKFSTPKFVSAEPKNTGVRSPALTSSRGLTDYTGWYALSYVDGSFFKIKNITLGWTLPQKWGKSIGIENLRLYTTITNPLVIQKSSLLKNYDPEMDGKLDYPLTKQFVFGVNLTF